MKKNLTPEEQFKALVRMAVRKATKQATESIYGKDTKIGKKKTPNSIM